MTSHPRNNFDFLRLAAAIGVLVSHQHALAGLPEPSFWGMQSLGSVGVTVFFVISGFLVAQSWQSDPHLGRFLARRLLRIWPGLAVVILLAAFLLGPLMTELAPRDYFSDRLFRSYFKALYFRMLDALPMQFAGNALPTAVNGSLWTIPLEMKCYLLLALAGLAGILRRRWLLLALVLATAALYMGPRMGPGDLAKAYHWSHQRRHLLEFALFFFAGTLLQVFQFHRSTRACAAVVGIAWLLAAAALAGNQLLLAFWLAAPASILAVAQARTPGLQDAGRFGDLSYGVYIYAFPVQQVLIWSLKDRMSWGALLALCLATTLTFAYASWHLIEKQALRLKPGKRAASIPAVLPAAVATA